MRQAWHRGLGVLTALFLAGLCFGTAANGQLMIVGNDEKPGWDKDMKPVLNPQGHDTLSIIDVSKPATPKITATIPLDNSIVGPPSNLAITPKGDLALVANSVNEVDKEGKPALVSDDRLFVIDLKANPPAVVSTITTGKKPSGLAIAADGKLALVCNRDDGTISVLSIDGKEVKVTDTVTIGAGTDQFPREEFASRGIRLASARGVNARAVAEHAMALMLALSRRHPEARDNQNQRIWRG